MAEFSRASLWAAILADLARGEAPALIARRFHETLADAVATLARSLAERIGAGLVALSGGVFHNRLLLEAVLAHEEVPSCDCGLALGQTAIAVACSIDV